MPVETREYAAFLGAAAVSFCFVVVVAGVCLRAQGRGKELVPLLVKLVLSLGVSGASAYWLGDRLQTNLGWGLFGQLSAVEIAVAVVMVVCVGYAIWSAANAVSPRGKGAE